MTVRVGEKGRGPRDATDEQVVLKRRSRHELDDTSEVVGSGRVAPGGTRLEDERLSKMALDRRRNPRGRRDRRSIRLSIRCPISKLEALALGKSHSPLPKILSSSLGSDCTAEGLAEQPRQQVRSSRVARFCNRDLPGE